MSETLLNHRYRLLHVLGSGGFGRTYVAEDIQQTSQPKCVIKQLKPVSQDPVFLEVARRLFFNEVEILRKLGGHDRIPALLNDFEEDHQFYLVQDYVEGRPLSDELADLKQLTEPEVVALLRDALEILEFVHQHNIVHRDIKPSNLMRRQRDRRIVLIDFGAVKEMQTQLLQGTGQTNLTVGIATQGYGPSEQLAGKPRYNSDIYALGITAIQALTGLHPSQLPTHPTTGEVIWRDRAVVTPWLARILSQMVRYHFNQRFQSAAEVLQALDQTALVDAPTFGSDETLVPLEQMAMLKTAVSPSSEVENVAAKPRRRAVAALVIGTVSLVAIALVTGARSLGWLQPLEIAAYDWKIRTRPEPNLDPRLLVVGITEADIQAQKRFPLSDETIAVTLAQLQRHQPRAIGLDIFRDIPQPPGRSQLLTALKAPNIVTITNLGTPITPAPPDVPSDRVGFNDVVLDVDSVVRRNLMFADLDNTTYHSFALRLAELYLAKEGIQLQPSPRDRTVVQLGAVPFPPLSKNAGGYQDLDDQGYQVMLNYRGRTVAQQVSLSQVLNGQVSPEQIKDRIVLIGTTAANAKDLFLTPFSLTETENSRLPGVLIHAQMVSQFLSAGLDGKPAIWYGSNELELLWIGSWAVVAGAIAWFAVRRPVWVLLGEAGLIAIVVIIGVYTFSDQGWIPMIPPIFTIILTAGGIATYRMTKHFDD
jgi:CHASE2 domain-containing sensor protein/tRNA A-37 threonylcarbamoyl transferase component Bud32